MEYFAFLVRIADGDLYHDGGTRRICGRRLGRVAAFIRRHHVRIMVQLLERFCPGNAVYTKGIKVLKTLHRFFGLSTENAIGLAVQIAQFDQAALQNTHVFAPIPHGQYHFGGVNGRGRHRGRRHYQCRRGQGRRHIGRCYFLGYRRHHADGLGRHGRHLLGGERHQHGHIHQQRVD